MDYQAKARTPKIFRSVHITNYYHPHSGGVKANYDKLLQAANRHRRYVSLIVPAESDLIECVGEFGKIYHVAAKRAPLFDRRYRLMLPFHYLFHETPIRNILLDEMPEMIEIYDNYSLTFLAGMTRTGYFRKLGRPMFVYFTGERFDTIFQSFVFGGKLARWISRSITGNFNLPMFDYYIAVSPFVAEEMFEASRKHDNQRWSKWFYNKCLKLLKALPDPLEERVSICPRGVDTAFFSPARRSAETRRLICSEANVPEDSVLLLSSTRLSPEKNVGLLVDIMEILGKDRDLDYRMLVAGAGPKQEWLRAEIEKRLSGKMILIGHLDKESMADHYANADVFVHPNAHEPFGNVGLEAMASGTAMVVPNSGGILTYANDQNAWVVEPDAASFARAIREASSDIELKRSKIEKALKTASANSDEAAMDLLFATYDKMFEDFKQKGLLSKPLPGESNTDAATNGYRDQDVRI